MKIKLLLALFVAINILGCSKDGSDDNDASFEFQAQVQNITDRAATVTWSRPEGSNIVFNIFLNNELVVENYQQTAYTFTGLSSETLYNGKIIASNGSETATVNFSFNTEVYTAITYEGSAYLSSQQQVNDFGSHHYNEIKYDLIIESSTIYDLSPLSDLKKVNGEVRIKYTLVQTLNGLENLEFVGTTVDINYNPNLLNFDHLENLSFIGEHIIIYSNPVLEDINGLSNVSGFTGGIDIEGSKIQNLNILNDATQLNHLYIGDNPELVSVTGFQNVAKIEEYMEILLNPALSTLSGLSSITEINGSGLSIAENTSLNSIQLFNLTTLPSQIFIGENGAITNLDCFYNVTSVVDDIWIFNQSMLGDFCGISNAVLTMTGSLTINGNLYNPTLKDFQNGDCSL